MELTSYAQFTATFGASTTGLANPHLAPSVAAFFVNGGQRLWVVRTAGADDAALIGTDGGPGARTGLQALRDVDDIGAVAIPGATSAAVQTAMIALCEAAGDRIAVLDPVSPTDPNAVIAQRAALATSDGFAALYFPHVIAAPAGVSLTLPPSGFVAGIYARNDPSNSPAGSGNGTVTTATGVSYAVTSTLQNTLNPLGINAIREFAGQGILVFGARTLASDPEWQYVAVRRTAIAIEQSIAAGTAWALFEPNDGTLWAQLRADVDDFMYSLYQAGWFQGLSPNDAYFVQCGYGTTMTQTDIEEGRTVIVVGFAPLTPAEFVVLRIVHERATLSVPEARPGMTLGAPRPNPARSLTTVSFELSRDARVRLTVFDVAGREVRKLADGEPLAAGLHERTWDGRDARGITLAAGVYVVRMVAEGRAIERRIALIR